MLEMKVSTDLMLKDPESYCAVSDGYIHQHNTLRGPRTPCTSDAKI